jgi:hypothetical protein
MSESTLWVAAYDTHWPKTNKAALKALLAFLDTNKVAGFLFGGDQLDFESISHHNQSKPLYKVPGSYLRDVETFDKQVLREVEKRIPAKATKVYIIGNHEDWERQLIEQHPELEGAVDHVRMLKLKERGWEVVPLGHACKLGKLNVIHGEILTGIGNQAGMYPSRKAVELYGGNVLAGHTHSPQSFTKISPVEKVQKHMGWIAPILGATNPGYLRNRPTAWLNGFVVIELWGPGNFNLYPVLLTEGKAAYGGQLYGGKNGK